MGYCLLPTVLFREFLILVGKGGAGKSVILTQLERIIGKDNVSSASMQSLAGNRFSSAELLNKQCNICADLPDGAINDTSTIKQLTGDDLIQAEYKGSKFFTFRNRAKLIFSCNALPTILNDRSDAFYSRLLIIRFFEEGKYIQGLKEELSEEKEIEIIISHIVKEGKVALEKGKLYQSKGSLKEALTYRKESDTVTAFIDECATQSQKSRETRPNLYSAYLNFCKEEERTPLGKIAFYKALETKGYRKKRVDGYDYFEGLEIKFIPITNTPFNN